MRHGHSTADRTALHAEIADESVCIGPPSVQDSYLNMNALISACQNTGATALHPGFGFLSESAEFAQLCIDNGITFIGPSPESISMLGDKARAKETMKAAGVPVIPGSDGAISSVEEAKKIAAEIGYPVLVKASAGGGGRGIRRVYGPEELPEAFESARAEAVACFGNGEMYLEKLILRPRHIEVQILADRHGHVISLGDRDCSVQRRNQKLLEEAPAWGLSAELRKEMGQAAVRAAKAVGYENAGTVEFLLDPDGQHFYFMEMNTRIQVEHGITELVTGVDLVREQLRIASGLPLSVTQEEVRITGHAMECRVNAEDPAADFRPCPGTVEFLQFSRGARRAVDSCLYTGCQMPPWYDSLAAKLMAYAPTRLEAIRKLRRCLEEFIFRGLSHQRGADVPNFVSPGVYPGMLHHCLFGGAFAGAAGI